MDEEKQVDATEEVAQGSQEVKEETVEETPKEKEYTSAEE